MTDTSQPLTIEDLALAIAAGGVQDPNAPIGVPAGYVPPIRGTGFSPGAGPPIAVADLRAEPYKPGDDARPGSLPPETIVAIQQQLVDGGLLRGQFQVGVWDPTTRTAYRSLLGYANTLGTTDEFALRRWMATGMGATDPTPTQRQPFVAEVTSPDDIRFGLREYFREHVGSGKIDEARLDAAVDAYQGKEITAQRSAYDLTASTGGGGTVAKPPSFEAFADEQAQQANPVAYDAHKLLDKFSAVSTMLGGQ